MSKEFQQIVSLAKKLNPEELVKLLSVLNMLRENEHDTGEYQFTEAEKAELRKDVELIDQGMMEMVDWEVAKADLFGE